MTTIAHVRPEILMELFVPLAVMLASEAFIATRPFTLEGSLLVMGAQMSCKHERRVSAAV